MSIICKLCTSLYKDRKYHSGFSIPIRVNHPLSTPNLISYTSIKETHYYLYPCSCRYEYYLLENVDDYKHTTWECWPQNGLVNIELPLLLLHIPQSTVDLSRSSYRRVRKPHLRGRITRPYRRLVAITSKTNLKVCGTIVSQRC